MRFPNQVICIIFSNYSHDIYDKHLWALPLYTSINKCKNSFDDIHVCGFLSIATWCNILCSITAVSCHRLIIFTPSPFQHSCIYLLMISSTFSLHCMCSGDSPANSYWGIFRNITCSSLSVNFKYLSCPFIRL